MRKTILAMLPLLALAGCGGGGGDAVTSISAPPTTPTDPNSTGTSTGSTTTTGGSTTGSTGSNGTTGTGITTTTGSAAAQSNMFDVTSPVTFNALDSMQAINKDEYGGVLYTGNAAQTTAPFGTISFDPRTGIFHMTMKDTAAKIDQDITFQDPLHRATPDYLAAEVPDLPNFNYLNVGGHDIGNAAFFYLRPSAGSFVTLAGYERYHKEDAPSLADTNEQGVMVFGNRASIMETPLSGTAHFDGAFLASMVGQTGNTAQAFQWIAGSSSVDVDFGARSVALAVTGTTTGAYINNMLVSDTTLGLPSGSTFKANGTASWTATNNAFAGKFSTASFTLPNATTYAVDMSPVSAGGQNTGASSIDGTFYGPKGVNVGGNIRITGGIPNQRVDILGGFVGVKK